MLGELLLLPSCIGCNKYSVFFFHSDEVIDETYGVAVQFDEEEEEVVYSAVFMSSRNVDCTYCTHEQNY